MGVALFGANKSQAPSSLSNEASLHHRVGALVGRACGEGHDLRRHELFDVHETLRNDAVLAWVLFGQLRDSLDSVHAVDDLEPPPVQRLERRTMSSRSTVPPGVLHVFTEPALMWWRWIIYEFSASLDSNTVLGGLGLSLLAAEPHVHS